MTQIITFAFSTLYSNHMLLNPLEHIVFSTQLDFFTTHRENFIAHALCEAGSGSFLLAGKRFEIKAGDFMVFPNGYLMSDFQFSADFKVVALFISQVFIRNHRPENNYDVVGVMALFENPVMPLNEAEIKILKEDILLIKNRLNDTTHHFHSELIGQLAKAFFLDIYDAHYRIYRKNEISERKSLILKQFIALLENETYMAQREVSYYASKLSVTPKYLSKIAVEVSGLPAQYWIERYTTVKIIELIRSQQYSLTQIADMMNFSSVSYFSRYVQRVLGMSPTEFRELG